MEPVILIKTTGTPNFENLPSNMIVKDIQSGQIYTADGNGEIEEIKTEKSNNWAKTFFYGGN